MSQFLKGVASVSYLIKYENVTLNFSLLAHGFCYDFWCYKYDSKRQQV